MKRSTLALVFSLAAVFLSGAVVGGFGYRVYTGPTVSARDSRPKPEEYRRRFIETMKERVKVTPEQVVLLNEIMDRTKARFDALDAERKPKKHAIFAQQHEEINSILTGEQQIAYAEFRQERTERRKKRNGSKKH